MLCILAEDADAAIKERAGNALLTTPSESFLAALKRPDAAPQLFAYCSDNLANKPGMIDVMAQNPACPGDLLVPHAMALSAESLMTLVENLERLVETPALCAAIGANPSLTAEQKKFLELMGEDTELDQAELAEAAAAAEADVERRQTLIQRLHKMRVVERIKLALTGNREERLTLIRDPNKLVQRAVLQSPKLTDQEVENFASMASLNDEILRLIAGNRAFIKNYTIVKRLISNPKVPLDVSLHLLPRLSVIDLKFLTMNKNIPETLRTTAFKMMKQRSTQRQG